MIKFFRKIRQKMLTENKFSKYLLYAVGEIVLVIIGILIALGINENAKDRNNLELRDLYIIQLNDEVNRNIKRLNETNNVTIELIKEVDTIIQLLHAKDYDNPKLSSKVQTLTTYSYFNPTIITYENLKFSGDLKLFDNLNLRNSISEPYETFNDIKDVESLDFKGISLYLDNFFPNVSFWDMEITSKSYAKEIYFQNMALARNVTLNLNRDAYENSIESLKKLKSVFAELENDN
jgi:hypothetical protein